MPSSSSKQSPAVTFLSHAWHFSKYPSHRQKNSTMHGTLRIATESGMKFEVGDIGEIYDLFRAHWWIGESTEGYYTRAVEAGNLTACRAWERYFDRPALLWPEKTAKPELLHVGSLITWEGLPLRITSFNSDEAHLIACGPSGRDDKGVRKKITFIELHAARKTADKRVKDWLARITDTDTSKELDEVRSACQNTHKERAFRHFDLEKLTAAVSKQATHLKSTLNNQGQRDLWLTGEGSALLFQEQEEEQNYLRIKNDNLEVSNGNTVPVSAAYALLGFIQDHRYTQTWRRPSTALDSEFAVAGHPLKEITRSHVIIGCTTILWTEIDRITQDLVKAHLRKK